VLWTCVEGLELYNWSVKVHIAGERQANDHSNKCVLSLDWCDRLNTIFSSGMRLQLEWIDGN
jgi:hypothetical protein